MTQRLALAAACFESTSHIYATMDTYRMGPIRLTPSVQSYYSALLSGYATQAIPTTT